MSLIFITFHSSFPSIIYVGASYLANDLATYTYICIYQHTYLHHRTFRIFGREDFLLAILKYQKPMIAWSKPAIISEEVSPVLCVNLERQNSSPIYIFKYQKPIIAWSNTGNHIGGNLPRFLPEVRKGGFSRRKISMNFFSNFNDQQDKSDTQEMP